MRIIHKNEVEQILTMEYAIKAVRECFLSYYQKNAVLPIRTRIDSEEHNGKILFMPAYLQSSEGLGVKVVSVYPENRDKGLQTIFSTILLSSPETGKPLAIMDGEYITAVRTGAVTAVAAELFAPKGSCSVALIGAGIQGMTQLEGVFQVREIDEVFIFDQSEERRSAFIARLQAQKWFGKQRVSAGEMDRDLPKASIIITATTSTKPVFKGSLVRPGAFISAVGGFTPLMQELEEELVACSRVVIDTKDGALKEAGDILIPIEKGLMKETDLEGELGEWLANGKNIRKNPEEIVIFKTVGIALQDMAVAPYVLKKAEELGLGMETEL